MVTVDMVHVTCLGVIVMEDVVKDGMSSYLRTETSKEEQTLSKEMVDVGIWINLTT